MLLGTQCDTVDDAPEKIRPGMKRRAVTKNEGEELARTLAALSKEDSDSAPAETLFFEVSAKTAQGMSQRLEELTRAVRREDLLARERTAERVVKSRREIEKENKMFGKQWRKRLSKKLLCESGIL